MSEISAVLIVKNEAQCLESCLSAVKNAVDEIVVLDTGSQDETVAIARQYTDKVYDFVWCDDFSAARNAAIAHATGTWCLTLDADEVLQAPEIARKNLQKFAEENSTSTLGTIEIESSFGGEGLVSIDHTQRFFHRESFQYSGAIHEQLNAINGNSTQSPVGIRVLHSGYEQSSDDPSHKALRNIPILKKCTEKFPEDEYYWYQIGISYYSLLEYDRCIEALEHAQSLIEFNQDVSQGAQGPVARAVLTNLVTTLTYAYINTEQVEKGCNELERHLEIGHAGINRADFLHALGYAYLVLGEFENARLAYNASLDLGPEQEDVQGTGSYSSYYHLGLVEEAEQNLGKALGQYGLALKTNPNYSKALIRCADIVVEYQTDLPEKLVEIVPQSTWERIWLERLDHYLMQGQLDRVESLVKGAASVSEELMQKSKDSLAQFVSRQQS